MNINRRQFSLLREMGIAVWQQNDALNKESIPAEKQENHLPVTLAELTDQPLFNDIIRCLGLSWGEISAEDNVLRLGLLNWQFIDQNSISLAHNVLISPKLRQLKSSPELKRQLWSKIQEYTLL